MRVGSLFSGIGGIELGLERAGGFETAWFVEWDAYAQAVLRKHWSGVPVYGDVKSIDWGAVEPVDVLTGGFPCQPHSVAGKRGASSDERDLWPECRRAIAALKPRVCLFENVPGLLTSEKGEFFKRVIDDFYNLGYRPRVYRLSARDVGALHLRKRIFIVAYPRSSRAGMEEHRGGGQAREPLGASSPAVLRQEEWSACAEGIDTNSTDVADSESGKNDRRERRVVAQKTEGRESGDSSIDFGGENVADSSRLLGIAIERDEQDGFLPKDATDAHSAGCKEQWGTISSREEHSPTEFGSWWEFEPDVGRVAHGVPSRVDRLKCLGNAVVPQCAEVIGRIIKEEMRRE